MSLDTVYILETVNGSSRIRKNRAYFLAGSAYNPIILQQTQSRILITVSTYFLLSDYCQEDYLFPLWKKKKTLRRFSVEFYLLIQVITLHSVWKSKKIITNQILPTALFVFAMAIHIQPIFLKLLLVRQWSRYFHRHLSPSVIFMTAL